MLFRDGDLAAHRLRAAGVDAVGQVVLHEHLRALAFPGKQSFSVSTQGALFS